MTDIEATWNIVSRKQISWVAELKMSKNSLMMNMKNATDNSKKVRGSAKRIKNASTMTTLLQRVSSRVTPDSDPLRDPVHYCGRLSHVTDTSNNWKRTHNRRNIERLLLTRKSEWRKELQLPWQVKSRCNWRKRRIKTRALAWSSSSWLSYKEFARRET